MLSDVGYAEGMSVSLRNSVTGQIKVQPEGWSWSCFFGVGLLGLPLFKRGLPVWGALMLVFDITALIVGWVPTERADSLYFWMSLIALAASFFFGLKANDMATRHALAQGWEFADPRRKWFD
jgi:hypothetical protein